MYFMKYLLKSNPGKVSHAWLIVKDVRYVIIKNILLFLSVLSGISKTCLNKVSKITRSVWKGKHS